MTCRWSQGDRVLAIGAFYRHFSMSQFLELFSNYAAGQVGGIAIAAEMPKDDSMEVGTRDLTDKISSLIVGEMTVTIADALLCRPGPLRVILKHHLVVVRFGEERVDRLQAVDDHSSHMANIAEDPDAAFLAAQDKSDGIDGVVRYGETLYGDSPYLEAGPGFKVIPDHGRGHILSDDSAGVGRCENGQLAFPAKDINPSGVVAVLMREYDSAERVRIDAEFFETDANLFR